MRGDDLQHVLLAMAGEQVLIDGDAAQEPEALFVAFGHHEGVAFPGAAHQVRTLNRGAGGTAADHAAALEQGEHLALGAGVEVRVDKTPLAAAFEPDASGAA